MASRRWCRWLGRIRPGHSCAPGPILWRDWPGTGYVRSALDYPPLPAWRQYGYEAPDKGGAALPAGRGARRALFHGGWAVSTGRWRGLGHSHRNADAGYRRSYRAQRIPRTAPAVPATCPTATADQT